jgi:hypothetical protein
MSKDVIIVNELRIGNLLDYFGCTTKVYSIKKDNQYYISAKMFNTDYYNVIDAFKPIKLTEEWLLKFGFYVVSEKENLEKKWIKDYEIKGEIIFSIDYNQTDDIFTFDFGIGYGWNTKSLKFVHELQNLYFVLTGYELNY